LFGLIGLAVTRTGPLTALAVFTDGTTKPGLLLVPTKEGQQLHLGVLEDAMDSIGLDISGVGYAPGSYPIHYDAL
jgi:hypothetical protein